MEDRFHLGDVLLEYLEEYNMEFPSQMHLVFFADAVAHVSRICRVLRQPRGNALLVGVGGETVAGKEKEGGNKPYALQSLVSEKKQSVQEVTSENRSGLEGYWYVTTSVMQLMPARDIPGKHV